MTEDAILAAIKEVNDRLGRIEKRLGDVENWRSWAIGTIGGAGVLLGSVLTLLVAGVLKIQA